MHSFSTVPTVSRLPIPWLSADPHAPFPPAPRALRDPNGLLAAGGDLQATRLLNAYRHGIFPWYSEGQPLLWWCPDPRAVFRTDGLLLPRRFRRDLRKHDWLIRVDSDFQAVVAACAKTPRSDQDGTWITDAMQAAYLELHRQGHAHSVEVFAGERLVGGIYGVTIGRMFFGESMFSAESGGSKAAIAALAKILRDWSWPLIDAQVDNPHLRSLGAELWPRPRFLAEVASLCAESGRPGCWSAEIEPFAVSKLC